MDLLASLGAVTSRWLNATNGLIAINLAIYLAMVASGVSWIDPTSEALLRWGADYGPLTLSGQYWRIITSAFVHIGLFHVVLNMWCLWSLGRLLERLLGAWPVVGIYLVTGAGASLLSLSWNPMRVSAGASGAIFGVAGAIIPVLYYGKLNLPAENVRKLLGYVVRFSLINLLYGLRGHIDNMAHLGGLVTGLAAGLFLARSFSLAEEDRSAQRRTVIALTAIVVAVLVIPVAKAKTYAVELNKGRDLLSQEDYSGAIEHLKKYTVAQPDDPFGHALLGGALQGAKRLDEAANEYERGLALAPDDHYIQVNLARIYVYQDKPEKAVKLFAQSIPHMTADADDYYDYARALLATGKLPEAEHAARQAVGLNNSPEARSLLDQIVQVEADAAAPGKKDAKNPNRKASGNAALPSR